MSEQVAVDFPMKRELKGHVVVYLGSGDAVAVDFPMKRELKANSMVSCQDFVIELLNGTPCFIPPY